MEFKSFSKIYCFIIIIIVQLAIVTFFVYNDKFVRIGIINKWKSPNVSQCADINSTNSSLQNITEYVQSKQTHDVFELYPNREYNISCRSGIDKLRKQPLSRNDGIRVLQWYKSIDEYFWPNRTDPIIMPEDEGTNSFLNYDVNKPTIHDLGDTKVEYFHFNGKNISCYKHGTLNMYNQTNASVCKCSQGFTGKYCSIPESVENSRKKLTGKYVFQPRQIPRRIIFAMTFNMEHIVLFMKLLQIAPAVDLFLILEGNITNYGDSKPLYLLSALKRGFMRRWHGKIMHMFNSKFLPHARERGKGFAQEVYLRGLFAPAIKNRVKNIRDDDLFLYFDADECPGLDELFFLKLHDGFPLPVGFTMQLFRYGLFWWDSKIPWTAVGVCTIKMFHDSYSGQANTLRGHRNIRRKSGVMNYGKDPLHEVWIIGSHTMFTGWHLAHFGTPGQLYTKLISTINADWPRYADNSLNRNITYLATLFKRGRFFDVKYDFAPVCPSTNRVLKDLSYIFKYPKYFNYLLVNPTIFIP